MNGDRFDNLLRELKRDGSLVQKLKIAEMCYKLAHGISVFCVNSRTQKFLYPETYTFGIHTVQSNEFSLNATEEEFASTALLHSATYIMAVQVDRVLQDALTNRFDHPNPDIRNASWIIRLIRNAFAHDPFDPVWQTYPECENKIFVVEHILSFSTKGIHGNRMKREDYGGPLALLKLSQFVKRIVLDQSK